MAARHLAAAQGRAWQCRSSNLQARSVFFNLKVHVLSVDRAAIVSATIDLVNWGIARLPKVRYRCVYEDHCNQSILRAGP